MNSGRLESGKWTMLVRRLQSEVGCVPFLGAGASAPVVGTSPELVLSLSQKLGEYDDSNPFSKYATSLELSQFVEYAAVTLGETQFPKTEICQVIRERVDQNLEEKRAELPHDLLASLPVSTYMTTNYDDLMYEALERDGKQPRRVLAKWWPCGQTDVEQYDEQDEEEQNKKGYTTTVQEPPTIESPIIFHLHGWIGEPKSILVTDEDYLQFMLRSEDNEDLIPKQVRGALVNRSLIFLGYRLADFNFRMLFRRALLRAQGGGSQPQYTHIAVVYDPSSENEDVKNAMREYLKAHLKFLHVSLYFGPCAEFVQDLRKRLDKANGRSRAA